MPRPSAESERLESQLDRVFFALSDPTRRRILERLEGGALLVSELAAPFGVSLQAVARHIDVLVDAGLIQKERTGRISRCSLDVGTIYDAAVWMNRYSKYWQGQFDLLATTLGRIERDRGAPEDVPDYEFSTTGGRVLLSELFGEHRDLIVVHSMGASCGNCTLWADGYNGIYEHPKERAAFCEM